MFFLRHIWAHNRGIFLLSIVALISVAFSTLLFPLLLHRFLDQATHPQTLRFYALCLIAAGMLLGITSAGRVLCTHILANRLTMHLEQKMYNRVLQQGPAFFYKKPLAEIFPIFFQDIAQLRTLLTSSLALCLRNSFLFLGGVALMLYTSLFFSLIILGMIALIVIPIMACVRFMQRFAQKTQQATVALTSQIRESLDMLTTVRVFHAQALEQRYFSQLSQQAWAQARIYVFIRALITMLAFFMGVLGIVLIIWLGTLSIMHAKLTSGALAQFLIAAFIAASSLAGLSESTIDFHNLSQIGQRMAQLLKAPLVEAVPTAHGEGIFFEHVSFSYPNHPDTLVLDDISFRVKKGEIIGVVGPSGSGKSTLLNLILGFYPPRAGIVGKEGLCTYVTQDTMLFNRSLLDNIRYGKPSANLEEVRRVAKLAFIDDFIMTLPNQYDTPCGERATLLSPGQRQRVAIARALLVEEAPILLLDEISSSLDAESEQAIMNTLRTIRAHYTIFMISHRLNTMAITDTIIFLENGRLILKGKHAELLKTPNAYKTFFDLQTK